MSELAILHMSDLHCRDHELGELEARVDAMLRDLRGLQQKPDLLLVSGDIAYSGQDDEYLLALERFFRPVMEALGLKAESVILCPGNHDIARNRLDNVTARGIVSSLTDTDAAQTLLDHEAVLRLQEPYLGFLSELRGETVRTASLVHEITFERARIGVAALDSSWLCIDDNSKERVFLTRRRVQEAARQVASCDLKLALFHHPLSWFHPSEQAIVHQDLQRHFDMLLVGHKHEADSRVIVTPSTGCAHLMSPSFMDGHAAGAPDGYNLYLINRTDRKVLALHRSYIRGRNSFDANVFLARGGQFEFDLPATAYANVVSTALARRVTEATEAITIRMSEQLKRAQQIEHPILLVPAVDRMTWREGEKRYTPVDEPFQVAMEEDCLVYGPPDVGSTTFLEEVCKRVCEDSGRLGIYVDYADLGQVSSSDELIKRLAKVTGYSESDIQSLRLTLVVDHFMGTDPEIPAGLLTIARDSANVVICVRNEVLFDTLAGTYAQEEVAFLRMRYWGPSRLREFAARYVDAVGLSIDPDLVYKFVTESLALSDLPVSPFLVALYMRVFLELRGELTGIPFVRLLERLEESSLDYADGASNYSIYNLRLMLMKLASACHEVGTLGLPREEFRGRVQEYFDKRALLVDSELFLGMLEQSGILVSEGDDIAFSCIVFFNYYLSKAIEAGETVLIEHLEGLHTALTLGDALAYYAGRNRDQESLARDLMRCLEEQYSPQQGITGEYLEKYIHHLLGPQHEEEAKNRVAQDAIEAKPDYKAADERFEKDQRNYRSVAKALMRATPPKDQVQKVAWNIMALKTFYNVFRNLEHIPAESKLELLDRILDFHLQCNIDLIDLYTEAMDDESLTSLFAYLITMGGEVFLSSNVGSVTLEATINALLENTQNDLKAFLLHCIYADLRLPQFASRLSSFIVQSKSPAVVEMGYFKVHSLLVRHEGAELPADLISSFNATFGRRQKLYGHLSPMDFQRSRDKAFNEAKRQHLVANKDRAMK